MVNSQERRQNGLIVVVILTIGGLIGIGLFWLIFQNSTADPYKESGSRAVQSSTVTIEDGAMEPTLAKGSSRQFQPRPAYDRGQIVWLNDPQAGPTVRHVRRIVAVAGDTLRVTGGVFYLNGAALAEPYLKSGVVTGDFEQLTVGPGHLFVLSDDRASGPDSLQWGAIPVSSVRGALLK